MISGLGTKLLKLFLTNILSLNLSQEMSLKVNYTWLIIPYNSTWLFVNMKNKILNAIFFLFWLISMFKIMYLICPILVQKLVQK